MNTFIFFSPKKGKNVGRPILQLIPPVFGYISTNVVFHQSSLHFQIHKISIFFIVSFLKGSVSVDYQKQPLPNVGGGGFRRPLST